MIIPTPARSHKATAREGLAKYELRIMQSYYVNKYQPEL